MRTTLATTARLTLFTVLIAVAASLAAPLAAPGLAQTLYRQPSLGFTQPDLPRFAPPLAPPGPVRTVPPLAPQPFVANQCQLVAGTCPLGRLQRTGSTCYCAAGPGKTRQGQSQVKPQGANPSSQ